MIDRQTEKLITIPAAARSVPPAGVHVATVWRWALYGLRDGRKLETLRVGGRTYTSAEALERFLRLDGEPATAPKKASRKQRERQIAAAEAELAAMGVR